VIVFVEGNKRDLETSRINTIITKNRTQTITRCINPAGLQVTFLPSTNTITVYVATVTFNLTSCTTYQENYGDFESLIPALKNKPVLRDSIKNIKVGDPTGSYCGTYSDIATIKATVLNTSDFELTGTVFGATVTCPLEAAVYIPSNNSIEFPNINSASDCLGSMLSNYGVSPSDLSATYNPSANSVNIAVGDVQINLMACSFKQLRASPSGTYCGSYDGIVTAKVVVESLTSFDISGTVEGQSMTCSNEVVSIQSNNMIVFPNIDRSGDCLGTIFNNYGISPDALSAIYFPVEDVIDITVLIANLNLTHSAC